ncbi:MAG: hypothetical protein SOI44_05995 [Lactimicrobium sp.]|jgi:5'-nucleotidase/UDP-sugar diphosphatase|uniref:hypothetical protein n=1 Tax=Lactimicrobium sp. TaxID=2563780 RepID=UPI002F35647A
MGKVLKKGILCFLIIIGMSVCALPVIAQSRSIRIVFTAGLAGQLDPVQEMNENGDTVQTGGFAALAGTIASLRNDATLVLDAGDFSYGTASSLLASQGTILSLMKQAGYDAILPGEKDFSYDQDTLVSMWNAQVDKPGIILSNVSISDTDVFQPSLLLACGDVQVGIFGVFSDALSGNDISYQEPIEAARTCVKQLQAQGADYIIGLCHDSALEDTSRLCDILSDKIDGIDLIINGHQMEMTPSASKEKNTWIVNADSQGRNVGVLDVNVDDNNAGICQYVRIDSALADEGMSASVSSAKDALRQAFRDQGIDPDAAIGVSDHVYTDPNEERSDTRDFIMDALSDAWSHQSVLPGRFAVSLAGADELVSALPDGEISAMRLVNTGLVSSKSGQLTQPLYGAYIKGSDLRKICEIDYLQGNRNALSQLAMGRMKYTVLDKRLPMNQVVDVYVRETDRYWAKVSDDVYYPLVYTERVKQILEDAAAESHSFLQVALYGDNQGTLAASNAPLKAVDGSTMSALWAETEYIASFPRGEDAVHSLAGRYTDSIVKVTSVKMNVHNYFVHTSRFGWMVYLGILLALVILIIILRIFAWIWGHMHPSQAGDD